MSLADFQGSVWAWQQLWQLGRLEVPRSVWQRVRQRLAEWWRA